MGRRTRDRYAATIIALGGLLNAGTGAWAFAAPESFYDVIATYPPYNEHFLHDIGAFLLGIGVALLAALRWRDAWFVVLLGGSVAATLHTISHIMDRHHGGAQTDPWLLGGFAVLLLVGLVLRAPARHGAGGRAPQPVSGGELR